MDKRKPLEMGISPRYKFTECELVEDEYLRVLRPHDNLEQIFW